MEHKELDFFIKQMQSNVQRAFDGRVVLTGFLNDEQQRIIEKLSKNDIDILFDGGFNNSESKRVIFKPKSIERISFKIRVFEIKYNPRYLTLNHRKVLGSLLSLGIKRESIGDIVFIEDKVYFAVTEEIMPFVIESFKTISGIPIELEETRQRIDNKRRVRIETHIVSSLRVDCIVAAAYKKSRAEVEEMIQNGFVQVNHMECLNGSKQLHIADVVSVRHKGRIYVEEIGGKTKSNRFIIQLGFLI